MGFNFMRSFMASNRWWWMLALALTAILITASLGRWQMSRAEQKIAMQQAIDEQMAAEVLTEERDVAADHRTEVEQQGVLDPLQAGEEFLKRLGGVRRFGGARDGRFGRGSRVGRPTRTQHAKEIRQ